MNYCFLYRDDDGTTLPAKVEEPPEEWAPWALEVSTKNPHAPPPVSVKTAPGPVWDIGQVELSHFFQLYSNCTKLPHNAIYSQKPVLTSHRITLLLYVETLI